MPTVLPTVPFLTSTTAPLTGIVLSQTAFNIGSLARISANIAADTPSGFASTLTSMGTSGLFQAPAGATSLTVTATGSSFENGLAIASLIAHAQAHAELSIFVEEFSPTGTFIRNIPGPPTVVYDADLFPLGVHIRDSEFHTRNASTTLTSIIGGRRYRFWIDSRQFVDVTATAHAASNFTYDFSPLCFAFS